jgi:hypothetical protein
LFFYIALLRLIRMEGGVWLLWIWLLLCICAGQVLPALNLTAGTFASYLHDYLYYGEVAFGLQEKALSLIIDTNMTVRATQLPIVTSVDCHDCRGRIYDQSESQSFSNLSEYEVVPIYTIGYCEGWLATDYLTLPFISPIPVNFVLVTSEHFSQEQRIEGVLVRLK